MIGAEPSSRRYGPGEEAAEFEPGDFILTHRQHLIPRLIRVAQRRQFKGPDRKYAHWSHAAVIVGRDGAIVESESKGVLRSPISKYRDAEYHVVMLGRTAASDDRAQVVAYAERQVGQPFGLLATVSLVFSMLTGLRIHFGVGSHQVCSGLVARALERTWADFRDDPGFVLPADLAKYYAVEV